jgi:hypothetical protein
VLIRPAVGDRKVAEERSRADGASKSASAIVGELSAFRATVDSGPHAVETPRMAEMVVDGQANTPVWPQSANDSSRS